VPSPAAPPPAAGRGTPFRELYDGHFAFTWRSLRYLGVDPAQLDDAVQEVWVAVHRRLADFEGRSDIKTWLFGIAINVQRNLYRSNQRRAALVPLSNGLSSQMGDPALEREGHEAWDLVLSFVATLDDTRRAVFVGCLLEGMSASEAARVTGLDVITIHHRVRSLRRSFRLWASAHRVEP
jgi:RNA polymerase sigma-70 factor (ECF subfamily)